jgi:chorismate dehydratase
MTTRTLRFGYTSSLHLLPLMYPLEAGWVLPPGPPIAWEDLPPSELLARLDAGDLDGALVPPVAYARRRRQLELLPGVGLASEGPTAAAVLRSAQRADLLDRQAIRLPAPLLDDAGATLMAVLLRPYFGVDARLLDPDTVAPEGMPLGGTVLTGDAAVADRRPWLLYDAYLQTIEPPDAPQRRTPAAPVLAPDPATVGYSTDLSAAWWVFTGVPLVWSLGVVRQALAAQDREMATQLGAGFAAARRAATEQQPTILAAAAARVDLPEPVISTLFAHQTTDLGPRHYGALDAFYTYTNQMRLTPR